MKILPALALVAALGCAAPRLPEAPTGPHFKVLSWNLNYGGPGAEQAPGLILEEDADIVCLQETTPDWERFLRPRLSSRYPHVRFHHSPGAGGLAFFSKFRLEEKSLDPSPVGWFPAWTVVAHSLLGPVQVQNLHLHPACNEAGSFTPSAYLSTSPRARLEEVKAHETAVDPRRPAIIVGDLNESSSYAVGRLQQKGFIDALPEFDRSTPTWRWTLSCGMKLSSRLDHVLYRPELRCLEARVIPRGGSDHYPVVAVFQAAERAR